MPSRSTRASTASTAGCCAHRTPIRASDALANTVTAVTGLDSAYSLAAPRTKTPAPPPPTGTSVGPCSHYWGERSSTHFPQPVRSRPAAAVADLRLHAVPDRIRVRHRSPAVVGPGRPRAHHRDHGGVLLPTIRADIDRFSRIFGLPQPNYREVVAPGTLRYPKNVSSTQDWYIEQALDIEWVHAVAPGQDRLYRCRQRRPRARPGHQRGGRPASCRRRLEQLGHARALRLRVVRSTPSTRSSSRLRPRAWACSSPPATMATTCL